MRRAGSLVVAAFALAAALAAAGRADAALAHGLDVSHWQGAIDWFGVAGGGHTFVFTKATEGTGYSDPMYAVNRSGAASIGLRVGAYHFARPAGSGDAALVANAIAQADQFVQVATPRAGDLPPVLDLEARGGLDADALTAWTQAWLDHVERRLGVKALIYTSPSFWKGSLDDTSAFASSGFRLWIAHWTAGAAPLVAGGNWGGLGWTFWQYSDCTKVPGISGCVDGDRFNGASPAALAIPAPSGGAAVAIVPPSVVGTPQVGKLLAAVPGRWNGRRPLTFGYQWLRCDAAGAGCVPIASATAASYTPVAADAGRAVVVAVTAIGASGSTTSTSGPTVAVAASGTGAATAPRATALPAIAGTPQVGQTLTASVGVWSGSPTSFSYQWRRCDSAGTCGAIDGAAGPSYTVTPDDVGATISLVVTATGRGGSGSAASVATAVAVAAPVPDPLVGSAPVVVGAGAVTTADRALTVSWQPGTVPSGSAVTVAPVAARLPLPGTSFRVAVMPAARVLPWPLDVSFAAAPADAVAGRLGAGGIWEAVPAITAPPLPSGQPSGSYRDAAGTLHVLAHEPGQLALFTAGAWGDPRFVPTVQPTIQRVSGSAPLVPRPAAGGKLLVSARVLLTSQARLTSTLRGRSTAAEVRRPGAITVRVRVSKASLKPKRTYRLVVRAVDPYGRKATLELPVRVAATRAKSR